MAQFVINTPSLTLSTSVVSGLFILQNNYAGPMLVHKVRVSTDGAIETSINRMHSVQGSESFAQKTVISGVVPLDTRQVVITSGFTAYHWNGTTFGMNGLSYTGDKLDRMIINSNVGEFLQHGDIVLDSQAALIVFATALTGTPKCRIDAIFTPDLNTTNSQPADADAS